MIESSNAAIAYATMLRSSRSDKGKRSESAKENKLLFLPTDFTSFAFLVAIQHTIELVNLIITTQERNDSNDSN